MIVAQPEEQSKIDSERVANAEIRMTVAPSFARQTQPGSGFEIACTESNETGQGGTRRALAAGCTAGSEPTRKIPEKFFGGRCSAESSLGRGELGELGRGGRQISPFSLCCKLIEPFGEVVSKWQKLTCTLGTYGHPIACSM